MSNLIKFIYPTLASYFSGRVQNDTIVNSMDLIYYGEAYFGTPKQKLQFTWDTGSSIPWVFSDSVLKNGFQADSSSTFTAFPEEFN